MKSLIIFLVSFLSAVTVPAQCDDMENDLEIPDTFAIVKSYEIDTVSSLTAIEGTVTDTLTNPQAYLVESDHVVRIAIKKKDKYIVFVVLSNQQTYYPGFSYERKDVDGRGSKELIFRWAYYLGRSGMYDGYSNEERGVVIWNLDNATLLVSFQNHYSYAYWETGLTLEEVSENDSTDGNEGTSDDSVQADGEDTDEENSGSGCNICESYDVAVEKMVMKIKQVSNCQVALPEEKDVYEYRLTKKGFVRVAAGK